MNILAKHCRAFYAALILFAALSLSASASAATFTVNSTADTPDAAVGNGVCADSSGDCTLRAAIQEANALAGADAINFSVTGTVNLGAALPTLSSNMTISGPGANLLTVRRSVGGFYSINVASAVTAGITGLTLTGVAASPFPFQSGGVSNNGGTVNLTNCAVSDNVGTGIANFNGGTLNLTNCTVSGNTEKGIRNSSATVNVIGSTVSGNRENGGFGAGIENFGGSLKIVNSTISGNTNNGGPGGGIFNHSVAVIENSTVSGNTAGAGAGIINNGTLTLTNVTVSGNTATVNRNDGGGGIINSSTLNLTNCTITGNTTAGGGGGIFSGNVTNFRNTIVAGNTSTAGVGHDLHGTFNSQDHNLIGNAGSATINGTTTHNITGQDPKLGPLADNGGPTLTHALLANSPALDAGGNALATDADGNPLLTDQRGGGRFGGAALVVDIGAYELHTSLEDFTDKAINEDTPFLHSFNTGDNGPAVASITATSDNQALIPDAGISASGSGPIWTLRAAPTADLSGAANISVTVNYANGVTVNDSFQLTVRSVNDAPSFTKGEDQTVAEDAGPQTVNGWATGISSGPPDESSQAVSFQVIGNTNAALFSAPPAVSPTGTLTFTAAPNANGSATVTIVAKDGGGTANGGQDTSAAQTFRITITPVNDAPSFTKGPDQSVDEDSGFRSVPGWAAGVSAGPGEFGQSLTFVVTDNTNPGLFSSGPSVAPTGTLSYGLAPNASGEATVTLVLRDSGGTADGGQDTSQPQIFKITVHAVNDRPVNTVPGPQSVDENNPLVFSAAAARRVAISDVDAGQNPVAVSLTATNGSITLAVTSGLNFTAGDGSGDASMTFTGTLDNINAALDGLTFNPAAGFSGTASLNIFTNDQGHTGKGGALTASSTISITVNAASVVRFSAAAFTVGEGGARATLTVTRTGNAAAAAAVDYHTADADTFTVGCADAAGAQGSAYARCDFATSVGTVSFAPGETTKTITVPIIDDAHVEGGETFQLRLSNPSGAPLGEPNVATVTITDNDAGVAPNPVQGPPHVFFVRQQYLDFLSREPDDAGFNAWLNVLNNCQPNAFTGPEVQSQCDRIHVSGEGFFRSNEFRLKGFYVFRFYKAAFDRLPEYTEIVSDMSFVAGATEAEVFARRAELAVRFTQRQEFTQLYGGLANAEYVNALMDRYGLQSITTPDPAAPDGDAKVTLTRQQLTDRLGLPSGDPASLTRAQVLRAVADSDQVGAAEFNNAFVAMQYYGYLRRKPEPAGYAAWLAVLRSGDVRTMVNGFLNSHEYNLRFGQP